MKTSTLDIAHLLQIDSPNLKSVEINHLAPLHSAEHGALCFFDGTKPEDLATTKASAVITTAATAAAYCGAAVLIAHKNPKQAYARVLAHFYPKKIAVAGQHPSAYISTHAKVHPSAEIGPNATIGPNVTIAEGAIIAAGCVLSQDIAIGANTHLHPNVTVYANTTIANDCIVHSGAVLGADGFGLARTEQGWEKLNHIGGLRIDENVEIGAGTCVDRGMLGDTHIEAGAKLDNLIQVAHNVTIGKRSALAGCSAIAGSAKIGSDCMIAGASRIVGHIEIANGTVILGGGVVLKSINKPGIFASPHVLLPRLQSHRLTTILQQLPKVWLNLKKAIGLCTT